MIIIVFGLPGSGKSYFAKQLADTLRVDRISSDKLRKHLFKNPTYSNNEKQEVYKEMIRQIREKDNYQNLVLDGTFYKEEIRDHFVKVAQEKGKTLEWIEIVADEHLIKKRLQQDRKESDADYDVYLKIKDEFEPMEEPHLVLSSMDIERMLEITLQYLKAKRRPQKAKDG